MFLDLGGNKGIQFEKIISIHDYDEFIKRQNYYLIKNAETQKRLIYLSVLFPLYSLLDVVQITITIKKSKQNIHHY